MTRTEIRITSTQEVIKGFNHEFTKNNNRRYINEIVKWVETEKIRKPFEIVEIEDGKEISRNAYMPII